MPDSPVEIANAVDEGLTQLKVAYQTAKGTLDSIEATDVLIDRLTIRTITVMDKVIEKGVPVVLDKLCILMTTVYPSAKSIVPIIKSAERYITVATKVVVRKGIRTLAQAAKPIVQCTVAKVKSVARKVLNFLKA